MTGEVVLSNETTLLMSSTEAKGAGPRRWWSASPGLGAAGEGALRWGEEVAALLLLGVEVRAYTAE